MKHINMNQQRLFDDLSPYKLHRKNDPQTSKEAAYSVPLAKTRAFVFNLITEAGEAGVTIREMTKRFPEISPSSITSRPNELEKLGLIFYVGDKRNGSRVIRNIKYQKEKLTHTHPDSLTPLLVRGDLTRGGGLRVRIETVSVFFFGGLRRPPSAAVLGTFVILLLIYLIIFVCFSSPTAPLTCPLATLK